MIIIKNVNDTFGHHAGDLVLKESADLFKSCSRRSDLLVRYGGEGFLLLLPGAVGEKAFDIAQRLHHAMGAHVFPEVGRVTASFGVATMLRFPEHLIARADQALYRAKEMGRNRVVQAEAEPVSCRRDSGGVG
ncbi:MAG: GGDEF domain-containing protein [Magnetococcales bacterium]|nr:GGDEF domain-containing protein [Magnetococcales bacterium]MBF0629682.1 GGDEF domain-containing protein [Magnetococcales bacterium]